MTPMRAALRSWVKLEVEGAWQAWVGSALAAVFTLFYLVLLSTEGVTSEDIPKVVGISLSLIAGSLCAGLAAWSHNRLAAIVLLVLRSSRSSFGASSVRWPLGACFWWLQVSSSWHS